MTDFAAVRAILDAATPGPWMPQSRDNGVSDPWYIDTHAYPDGPEPVWAPPQYEVSEADARAIVTARNLLPELLAVAEAALRREKAEELLAEWDEARSAGGPNRPTVNGVRDALAYDVDEAVHALRTAIAALDAKLADVS